MKGINIQFDNLVALIEKNVRDKQLLKSRDNFELVYEKITQEAFKTVNLIFDNLLEDFSIKLSFSKLLKQLKKFLSLKPANTEQDEDEYFEKQFDEVKQFMNNRKPVMQEVDTSQRGDIYKFLFQAQNKEKDMEQFMGNMNKLSLKDGKRFKTLKHVPVITEDIQVQTDLGMQFLVKLQSKFPTIFRPVQILKTNTQNVDQKSKKGDIGILLDFDTQIDELVRQRMQQLNIKSQVQKKDFSKQQSQNEKQSVIKTVQSKKKKPQQGKRNSELSLKRNSNQLLSNSKTKSGFTVYKKQPGFSQQEEKSQQQNSLPAGPAAIEDNSTTRGLDSTKRTRDENETNQQLARFSCLMPSFSQMCQRMSDNLLMQGVSLQQVKYMQEALKANVSQSLMKNVRQNPGSVQRVLFGNGGVGSLLVNKAPSAQKQCNTIVSYASDAIVDSSAMGLSACQNQNSVSRSNKKESVKKNKSISSSSNYKLSNLDQNNKRSPQQQAEYQQAAASLSHSKIVKFQSQPDPKQQIQHDKQQTNKHLGLRDENLTHNMNSSLSKNVLPQISRQDKKYITNNMQRCDSTTKMLIKQGKSAQQYLKKLRDTKYIKGHNNSNNAKSLNKENYTLNMYMSKKENKSKVSQHINLPSLNRSTVNNRGTASLHQNINELSKSLYLKKSSKKHIQHESSNVNSTHQESTEILFKKEKGEKQKDTSKQEEKIMKELQKISKEGATKSNIKHIARCIQFVESVHKRRCGEKCIHLQRFYDFLHRNNLPNRRQFLLHKTDMNMSVQL